MSRAVQTACACSAFAFVVFLFGGLLAAHWVPPLSPHLTASETAAFYRGHANGIRFASVLIMFGAGLTIPFSALMVAHVRRMEGPGDFTPLAWTNALAGAAGVCAVFMPAMLFAAAAYRPERDAHLTQLISDAAWIPFIMNGPPAITQAVSFGVAVLGDKQESFPRWLGYYNFWVAFCFLPACILPFFKTGPFAWNGLLSFWLAAAVFGSYFLVMATMFLRARVPAADERAPEQVLT